MRTCGSAVVAVVGPVVGAGDLEIGAAHLLDQAGDGNAVQLGVKAVDGLSGVWQCRTDVHACAPRECISFHSAVTEKEKDALSKFLRDIVQKFE